LFPASKDAVIDAGLLTFRAALETVIGAKVAAKLLNMSAQQTRCFGRHNPPEVRGVNEILATPKS
jgi:hypothetical protein